MKGTLRDDHNTPERGYCDDCRDMAARIVWGMRGRL
jgi:hypothetical protein